MCDNFPRQFHFFLGAIHEKHKFKYFKNLTVKVCKIWYNDVYISILQCDIFWWKLIDRKFFNSIFNTKVVLRASPLFSSPGLVSYCHHFSSVVCRPSINISHFNLLLRNHWANYNQTLVEWSLDGPLPKLCPVIPTSSQDGHQAKNRKKGG